MSKLCRCCKEGLIEAEIDSFDVCSVCGWEDDEGQNEDPDLEGGANGESLNQYRKWFEEQRKQDPTWKYSED